MKPSTSLLGASRFALTPKRGNKDFYKGNRQSTVPGQRTGPPGKHVLRGTAKFRLMDERVRYFVGPGQEALETTDLKPYVSTQVKSNDLPRLPLFAPNAQPRVGSDSLTRNDFTRFSKRYQRLQPEERHALILDSRRKWWDAVSQTFQV